MSSGLKKLKFVLFVFCLMMVMAVPAAAANRPILSVKLSAEPSTKKKVSYHKGQKLQIHVRNDYKYSSITYKTSDSDVVSVSKKGVVRLKEEGQATVRVYDKKTKDYYKIKFTVTDEDTVYDAACKYGGTNKYFIRLKKSEFMVYVMKKKFGEWILYKQFPYCIGAPGYSTPSGMFRINGKGLYFTTEIGTKCWYYSRIVGSILFHSQIYSGSDNSPVRIVDASMQRACSHGCVRLHLQNAYWIYRWIPNGTPVFIS